jgi:hypothetical protein
VLKKTALVLAVTMILALGASAQTSNVYMVSYFENANTANAPDATVYVINTGVQGAPYGNAPGAPKDGDICVNVYVFDAIQEMLECCSAPLSANGLATISVNALTANPLTSVLPTTGVIKITSSLPNGATCDPTAPTSLVPELKGWEFFVHAWSGGFASAEAEFQSASLSTAEQTFLPSTCGMVRYLGSGKGTCDSALSFKN